MTSSSIWENASSNSYSLHRMIIEWDQFTMRNISVEKKNVRSTLLAAPTKIDPQLHFEFFMWVWVLQCWTSSKSLGNCKNNGLMANHHNCNIGRLKVLGIFYYVTLLFIDYQIHALIQYFSLSTMKASIAKYLAKVKRGKNRDAQ